MLVGRIVFALLLSALHCLVSHIVSLRSKPKMIGVNARRNATQMVYIESVWYWTLEMFVRKTVSVLFDASLA